MQKKILFIYTSFSSFVRSDFEILSAEYLVEKYHYKPVKGLVKNGIQFLKQFIFLLLKIRKYDIVYIWFADYHSLLPVLFTKITGKKSMVVIGGYDICRIKSLHYGVFVSKFRSFFAYYSMKLSSCNLTVSGYVDRKVKWILPNSNCQLIYNGVRLVNEEKEISKQNLILTVGNIDSEQTFFRKGIDVFIEVAKHTPQYQFIIVGIEYQKFRHFFQNLPVNLQLISSITQSELISYYKKAIIYAQFSKMDTFCLTLAEAMLFECFPIITNEGGMPEVIGDTGLIVKRNPLNIAEIIRNLNITSTMTVLSRQRVENHFLLRHRQIALVNTIENSC